MTADDLLLELTAARLRIAGIELQQPYGRLTIYQDASTNIGDVLAAPPADGAAASPPPDAAAPETAAASPPGPGETALPLAIEIGEVRIVEGSADFADLSLVLPFASRIDSLDGRITEMTTGGTSARVELEGTVDEYGLAKVEGSLDFFAPDRRSDVAVAFRNVEMSRLSPYTSQFAGYAVEEGRLSLDLRYRLQDRTLESENQILIDRLTLGKKVEHPDAPNLPVKLAVALPKDKDLDFVEFAAADSRVPPPSKETLATLARALGERPELLVEVRGVFDPDIDTAALRRQKLEDAVQQELAATASARGQDDEPVLASEVRRQALESLFVRELSGEELDALAARHTIAPAAADGPGDRPVAGGEPAGGPDPATGSATPGPGAPEPPVLDLAAYLDDLTERLVELQDVTESELMQLAEARAAAIGEALASAGVPAGQVRLLEGGPIKKKDAGNNLVRLRLVATAG